MTEQLFTIPNITCGHCVTAIAKELNTLDGVTEVKGDPDAKTIDVTWEAPATLDRITETLKEIGYPAA